MDRQILVYVYRYRKIDKQIDNKWKYQDGEID